MCFMKTVPPIVSIVLWIVVAFWVITLRFKSVRRDSKISVENRTPWTRKEEFLRAFLLNAYLALFVHALSFMAVFDFGDKALTMAEVLTAILKTSMITLIIPLNAILIIILVVDNTKNNKLKKAVKIEGEAVKPNVRLLWAAGGGYFAAVAASTLCFEYGLISSWSWFTILVYGYIVALGFALKAIIQPE